MNAQSELSEFEKLKVELSDQGISYLKESAKWGKFLSILGFILCGIMFLVAIMMSFLMSGSIPDIPASSAFPEFGGAVFGGIYAFLAIIYLMPSLYLYRYSTNVKSAIESMNNEKLNLGLKNLKSMFKFMGIFAIVILVMYGLLFIGGLIFGGIQAFS